MPGREASLARSRKYIIALVKGGTNEEDQRLSKESTDQHPNNKQGAVLEMKLGRLFHDVL